MADETRSTPNTLANAIAGLSRALGQGVQSLTLEARDELIAGLNEAAEQVSAELNPSTTRRSKAEKTRAELIQAATRVFAAKGFEAASVADIAQDAGYTKGAFYSHFSSKEELFLTMLKEITDDDDALVDISENQPVSDGRDDRVLSLEAYLYGLRHPEARDMVSEIGRRQLTKLAQNVRRERAAQGIGDPDEPPTQVDHDIAFGLAATDLLGGIMVAAGFQIGDFELESVPNRVNNYLLEWPEAAS